MIPETLNELNNKLQHALVDKWMEQTELDLTEWPLEHKLLTNVMVLINEIEEIMSFVIDSEEIFINSYKRREKKEADLRLLDKELYLLGSLIYEFKEKTLRILFNTEGVLLGEKDWGLSIADLTDKKDEQLMMGFSRGSVGKFISDRGKTIHRRRVKDDAYSLCEALLSPTFRGLLDRPELQKRFLEDLGSWISEKTELISGAKKELEKILTALGKTIEPRITELLKKM